MIGSDLSRFRLSRRCRFAIVLCVCMLTLTSIPVDSRDAGDPDFANRPRPPIDSAAFLYARNPVREEFLKKVPLPRGLSRSARLASLVAQHDAYYQFAESVLEARHPELLHGDADVVVPAPVYRSSSSATMRRRLSTTTTISATGEVNRVPFSTKIDQSYNEPVAADLAADSVHFSDPDYPVAGAVVAEGSSMPSPSPSSSPSPSPSSSPSPSVSATPGLPQLINQTYDILADFYWATGGPSWFIQTGWLNRSIPYCEWYGVLCCDSVLIMSLCDNAWDPVEPRWTIYGLLLTSNNLVGSIPASFTTLPALHPVQMLGVAFSPSFRITLKDLLPFTGLSVLLVQNCNLTGAFTDLVPPNFSFNRTSMKPSAVLFPALRHVNLIATQISGVIVEPFLLAVPRISYFFLSSPLLAPGTIPTDIGLTTMLYALVLPNCQLTGPVPPSLFALERLGYADLSSNELSGPFPGPLLLVNTLFVVDLSNNVFSGPMLVPGEILSNISRNPWMDGSIVADRTYEIVDISYNRLTGSVPHIQAGIYLGQGNLFNESVTDFLMRVPLSCASIIDFSDNPFQPGPFIAAADVFFSWTVYEIFTTERLISFSCSNCQIVGPISTTVLNTFFMSLQNLDLSYNPGITGPLPVNWILDSTVLNTVVVAGSGFRMPNDSASLDAELLSDLRWSDAQFLVNTFVYGGLPMSSELSTDYGNYSCPSIKWNRIAMNLIGLNPEYYDYHGCSCNRPLTGRAPNCVIVNSSDTVVEVVIPLVIVICVAFTTAVLVRRRVLLSRRERRANAILAGYSAMKKDFPSLLKHLSTPSSASNDLRDRLLDSNMGGDGGDGGSGGGGAIGGGGPHSNGSRGKNGPIDSDIVIPFKKIEILRTIAHGASGFVSLGVWQTIKVAVKQYYPTAAVNMSQWIAEAQLHARLRHPNIVLLVGVTLDPFCTLTEFMDRGSLFHLIHSSGHELEVIGRRRLLALQIAQGMNYLHSKEILHRDLKSLNVLVDSHWTAKVADFGESRVESRNTMTAGIGTTCWMAPETIDSGKYSSKCDVYGYGIIVWELVSGVPPFSEYKFSFEIMDAVRNGKRPTIPDRTSPWCRRLIESCWAHDPETRPTFTDILNMFKVNEDRDIVEVDERIMIDPNNTFHSVPGGGSSSSSRQPSSVPMSGVHRSNGSVQYASLAESSIHDGML